MGEIPKERPGPPASSYFPDGQTLNTTRWPEYFDPADSGRMFPPGEPLWPIIQEPLRTYDYRTGINIVITPRTGERWSFADLRSFANVELVRLAIETRKDQIDRCEWQIKPKVKVGESRSQVRKDSAERIRAVSRFLRKPDGYHNFHEWIHLILEDLFVIDAPCLERRRNYNGDIVGYDVIDGSTIKVLLDYNARTPTPPAPAYQQIIKGSVWCDLTTDDILYRPRNIRPGHVYGFSPVEQILITIHTQMLRQASQLSYFSDGTVPAGLASVPDGWSVDQVREWQDWMDAKFAGNLAERRKLLWAPAGSKYQAFKESPIKDDFDEWLARVTCYCFSLPPTPFIRQLNRSASQADQERAIDEGEQPLKMWLKRFLDGIIQDDLKYPDLEFTWIKKKDENPETDAQINTNYLKVAVLTINEIRDGLGMDKVPGGDTPLIYTPRGAIALKDVISLPPEILAGGATAVAMGRGKPNGSAAGSEPAPKKIAPPEKAEGGKPDEETAAKIIRQLVADAAGSPQDDGFQKKIDVLASMFEEIVRRRQLPDQVTD
jgi:hypothetical protein